MTPQAEQRIRDAMAELGDAILGALADMDATDAPERLLTVPETAERLRVARSTVYGLITGGALRSVRVSGRRLVPSSYVAEYLAEQAQAPPGAGK